MNKYSPYPGDKVPAMLEKGEYVLNRNAVKAIGKKKLDKVNHNQHPRFLQSGGGAEPPMVNIPPSMTVPQELQQKALKLQHKYRHLVMPKAVKKEVNDLLAQSRAMSPTPTSPRMPDYYQQGVQERTRSNEGIARQNQKQIDSMIVQEGKFRNEIDQAVNLSRGKQTLDLARTKLRDLSANNANTKSMFDDMYKDTPLGDYANFMRQPPPLSRINLREGEKYGPSTGSVEDGTYEHGQLIGPMSNARRQATEAAKNMTSDNLRMSTNPVLQETIRDNPSIMRYVTQNDKRVEYATNQETQAIADSEASAQRYKEWEEKDKLEMSKIPKFKYNFAGGISEKDMKSSIKKAVEDKDYSSLQRYAQGFQGSDGIDNGYGLYSLLNMQVLAKEAGMPQEELETLASMGDQARVDKANRGHGPARIAEVKERKVSTASKIRDKMKRIGDGLFEDKRDRKMAEEFKGSLENKKIEYEDRKILSTERRNRIAELAKRKPINKAIAIQPVTGTDRDARTKVHTGPNQPDALDPLQFADQKSDLMKRGGMKVPALMAEGGFLSNLASGAQKWATQDWGDRYTVDAEKNAETLKFGESRDTLSQMEGFGDMDEDSQSKLIKQRAQGLADNAMYGEQDDDWETDDEDKINPANDDAMNAMAIKQTAGKLGVDALKGTAYGAAGLAAAPVVGTALTAKGLYKGAKATKDYMTEGTTDFDKFQKTGEGSKWQKTGGMLSKLATFGRGMNEDMPFSSMMDNASSGPDKKAKTSADITNKKDGMDGFTNKSTPQQEANAVADSETALNTITDPLNQDLSKTDGVTKLEDASIFDEGNTDMVNERQAILKKAGLDIGTSGAGGDGIDGQWGEKSQAAWDEYQAMVASDEMTEDADGKMVHSFGHDYTPSTPGKSSEELSKTYPVGVGGGIYTKKDGGFISGIMRYQSGGEV